MLDFGPRRPPTEGSVVRAPALSRGLPPDLRLAKTRPHELIDTSRLPPIATPTAVRAGNASWGGRPTRSAPGIPCTRLHPRSPESLVSQRHSPNTSRREVPTEHRAHEDKAHYAVVLNTSSRRVVGWSIDSHQTAALATNFLSIAIANCASFSAGLDERRRCNACDKLSAASTLAPNRSDCGRPRSSSSRR